MLSPFIFVWWLPIDCQLMLSYLMKACPLGQHLGPEIYPCVHNVAIYFVIVSQQMKNLSSVHTLPKMYSTDYSITWWKGCLSLIDPVDTQWSGNQPDWDRALYDSVFGTIFWRFFTSSLCGKYHNLSVCGYSTLFQFFLRVQDSNGHLSHNSWITPRWK